jgi:hypothetical protein
VEMKRPTVLEARSAKRSNSGIDVWIAGTCKMVSAGLIEV